MLRPLILAASLLALTACGPADKPASGKAAASPGAGTAPAAPAAVVTRNDASGKVDRFTPYLGGALALDEFSVGPVMAQTDFSMEAIKPRFPRATVKSASLRQGADAPTAVITVEQGGGVIEIQGNPGTTKVGDVRVSGGSPQGPRGETLGLKWADADMDYPRCWRGKDLDAQAVICTQPGEPVLRYVFAVPGWTEAAMPPEAVLRDKAVLHAFLWRGGAPAP